jgi:hypothetical protein
MPPSTDKPDRAHFGLVGRMSSLYRTVTWLLTCTLFLIIASEFSASDVRFAMPFYSVVSRCIADIRGWKVESLELRSSDRGPYGHALVLTGSVSASPDNGRWARVVTKLGVGAIVETPLVFWLLLVLWPTRSSREWGWSIFAAVPIFLVLEAATTITQLIHNLPDAEAILAGDLHPVTSWQVWSRFLEEGGRFAVVVLGASMAVSLGRWLNAR